MLSQTSSQLFTTGVREHQSSVTCFDLVRSHQTYILFGYIEERDDPQPTILLSMDGPEGHINSADRSLVAQLLDQKLIRNIIEIRSSEVGFEIKKFYLTGKNRLGSTLKDYKKSVSVFDPGVCTVLEMYLWNKIN